MIDFKYLVINRHAIIQRGERVTAENAQLARDQGVLILGVNPYTLDTTIGTLYAYDVVEGESVIELLDPLPPVAHRIAYIINYKEAPKVLYKKGNHWVPGLLCGIKVGTSGYYRVTSDGCNTYDIVHGNDVMLVDQAGACASSFEEQHRANGKAVAPEPAPEEVK